MAIILNLLKWIGIILLILLALALVVLLLLLLVPFRYKAAARVDDPDVHSEFPMSVIIERFHFSAEVSWLLGFFRALVSFPAGELISVKILGRDIGLTGSPQTGEQEEKEEQETEKEEEEEETSLTERAEKAMESVSRTFDMIDYMYRIITGTCGRRATAQIWKRFTKIFLHILPTDWNLSGTVGLSDPSLNGKMAGACAVLMPVCDDHLQMETEWEDYRCDLSARVDGRLRMFVPVREAVLLFLNKDCRKLYKKLMKARSKFASRPPEEPPEENKGGTELTKTDQQD